MLADEQTCEELGAGRMKRAGHRGFLFSIQVRERNAEGWHPTHHSCSLASGLSKLGWKLAPILRVPAGTKPPQLCLLQTSQPPVAALYSLTPGLRENRELLVFLSPSPFPVMGRSI